MVPSIALTVRSDGDYDVTVDEEGERTTYRVAVPTSLAAEVGHPGVDPAELVRQSFEFLLEREPAHSILRRFNLEVIERYFSEYRAELARRLG